MEFIDGGDLRQYMQKHHKANSIGEFVLFRGTYRALMSVQGEHKAAFFTYQICDGLAVSTYSASREFLSNVRDAHYLSSSCTGKGLHIAI